LTIPSNEIVPRMGQIGLKVYGQAEEA
jgi:hypothetical protein